MRPPSTARAARSPRSVFDAELRLGLADDRLCVRGVVDAVSAPLLRDDLAEALKTSAGRRLVIDLDDVTLLSAAGVGVLVAALDAAGHHALVISAGSPVRRVLALCEVPYRLVEPAPDPSGRTATGGRSQHRAMRVPASAIRFAGLVRGLLP